MIETNRKIFSLIATAIFSAHEAQNEFFRDYLDDEGFGLLNDVEPACPRSEYNFFVDKAIAPIQQHTESRVYAFQAQVLELIYSSPGLAEQVLVSYSFNE